MRLLLKCFISLSFLFVSVCYADEKLVFAIDVIRHGDRTPTHVLPKDPFSWPGGLGELTDLGVKQEFELGQSLREHYIESAHLLPERYQPDSLYIRSTNVNRTLMSAESLLYGLYPLGTGPSSIPGGYQPIPIHTIKKQDETLLIPDQDEKKFAALMVRYVLFSSEWRAKDRELQPQYARWSQLTGLSIHHLQDLIGVGDNIYIRQLRHIPLPKEMTKEDARQIVDAGEWAFIHLYLNPGVGHVTSRALLTEIKAHLVSAAKSPKPLKWVLYSAHDSTLLSLLSALNVPSDVVPHYASDLSFMLSETGHHEYIVRVLMNGELVQIPSCHPNFCTLDEFKKIS